MKAILLIVTMMIALTSLGQNFDKYRMKGRSIIVLDADGFYLFHKEWEVSNDLFVTDAKNIKLTHYKNGVKEDFDIISVDSSKTDLIGNLIIKMNGIDNKGEKATVEFINLKESVDGFRSFINIIYNERVIISYRYVNQFLKK